MGMFTIFEIYIDSCKAEVEEKIINELKDKFYTKVFGISSEKGTFTISTDSFTVYIDELKHEDVEDSIMAYGLILSYSFYFQLYQKYDESEEKVMEFVSVIMKLFEGDCAFCPNGDMRFVRDKGRIIVDETNKIKYSFDLLGLPYEKGDISEYGCDEIYNGTEFKFTILE